MIAARMYPTNTLTQLVAASRSAALRRLWRVCHALMGPFAAPFAAPFVSSGAIPWYLAPGLNLVDCVAAYQAKGAASLEASYVNLAHPGVNNAAPVVAPTWSALAGWIYNGAAWLNTGILPASGLWSMLVCYSGASVGTRSCLCGCLVGGTRNFVLYPSTADGLRVRYANGNLIEVAPALAGGVLGVSGAYGYRNGVLDSGAIAGGSDVGLSIYIGAANLSGAAAYKTIANIQSCSIYNVILDATQNLILKNQMMSI
jgi:hypothetical protein